MDKNRIIEDFFRSLKITLTNAFSYSKNHPYFLKSVENLNLKLKETLVVINPLIIGVTSQGFVVDEMNLTQVGFYDELARIFHQRKIKSIKINSSVTFSELVGFLTVVSMAPKDIYKNGGVSVLLEKKQLVNFTIEELDYSVFLQGQGQECTDIWGFMLKEATQSNDEVKINNLADNFGSLIKRVTGNEIFETEEISSSINEFLACLKEKNKDKFDKCAKDVFLWLLHNKGALNDQRLSKLKPVFDGLNQEDFTTLLWEGLAQEDNFDTLSLQLFSKISEQKNPVKITEGFSSKINALQHLNGNSRVVKRIQDLLAETQSGQLSAVYRNTLESLIKSISSSGMLFFDQKSLEENYRYIVLNILSVEQDKDNLSQAAEAIDKELAGIFKENDLVFLKDLWSQLIKRKNEGLRACVDLERRFSTFVENIILNQTLLPEQECFFAMVSSPSQEVSFYLDKIFSTPKTDRQVLSLFFKFFPQDLDIFYQRTEQKLSDIEFLSSLIEALGQLDLEPVLEILEHIYICASELIKVEILKIMRKSNKVDVNFLTRQLSAESFSLRKSILSVLILDAQAKESILGLLFKIPSFCGTKNGLLEENMQMVYDLGFRSAIGQIQDLSKRKFFWNKELRNKAKEILKEWNVQGY